MYVRLIQNLYNTIGIGSGQTYGGTALGPVLEYQSAERQRRRRQRDPHLQPDFHHGLNGRRKFPAPAESAGRSGGVHRSSQLSTFKYPASVGAPLAGTLVNPTQVSVEIICN